MSKIFSFFEHKGLDLVSSDQSRPVEYASLIENAVLEGANEAPRIEKRKGSQVKATGFGGFGLIEFTRLNPSTAEQEKELLTIDKDSLYRIKKATASISYGGAGTTATVAIAYAEASSQLALTLTVDGSTVLTYTLGQGFEEASTKTLANLKTAVEAVSGWTCTLTGTTSLPAAFCDVTPATSAKSTSVLFTVYEGELITDSTGIFEDWTSNQDQTDFEEMSPVALNNVLYFPGATVYKYDGQRVRTAGKSSHTATASQHGSLGALAAGTRYYRTRYVRIDAVGNVIKSPLSDPVSCANAAGRGNSVTVESAGFRLAAQINGAHVAQTTLTVDAGHTILAGDLLYLWTGSAYVTTRVSAVTTTTITVADAITISDNAFLNLNEYMEIWRTEDGASESDQYYLVAQTSYRDGTYLDVVSDATLTASEELIDPEYDFGPPPACRYITVYKGGLVFAGVPFAKANRLGQFDTINQVSPNDVHFADYEFPEGVPEDGSFTVSVESELGDIISGMKENGNSLVVFKDKSVKRLYGDPTQLDIQSEWLSKEVGCLAHATIQEVMGQLVFLSKRGVESIIETQAPDFKVGYKVKPIVEIAGLATASIPRFKRSRAHVFVPKQYYILWIPTEGTTAADTYNVTFPAQGDGVAPGVTAVTRTYANSNSRILVMDYSKGAWYEWSDLNMAGGIATFNDELWWVERRYSTYASAVKYNLRKRINNAHATDYEDHNAAIDFRWGTAWLTFGDRKVKKQPLRLSIASTQETASNDYTLTVKQEVNFVRDTTKAQMSLAVSESATHGTVAQTKLANGKFPAIRFLFENSEHNTNVEIEGWEVEVDLPYIGELKT